MAFYFKGVRRFGKIFFDARSVCLSLCVVCVFCYGATAQFSYVREQSIPVSDGAGARLRLPWTGGINAAQFSTMDLNSDNNEDLVLFDRMADKVMTFLNIGRQYVYAPEYETLFPDEIRNWVLLRDFDGDGRKDIFCGDPFGIRVYQNTTTAGAGLTWKPFKVPLFTEGFSGEINLQLRFDDLPAIVDVDNDGDLDIFNVRFSGSGTVEFHRNLSVERYGRTDSLDYQRQTIAWGKVRQCLCEKFAFDDEECTWSGARQMHASGKALLAIDLDNDGDHELLYSEAGCSSLFLLQNLGDNANPVITSVSEYPERPVKMNYFPAAFFEDVDFDGVKDLIITPNLYVRDSPLQDLKVSTWLYKNTGSDKLPQFNLTTTSFLQNEMIDVGDNSVPTFVDIDSDGDQDMFIGTNADSNGAGSIYYYRNTGTATSPQFDFVTDDFGGLRSLKLYNIKPQFADLSSDGRADLVFSGTTLTEETTKIYYIENYQATFDAKGVAALPFELEIHENFHFTHINHDGKVDLLVGRSTGQLEYWQNTGTSSYAQFTLVNPAYLKIGISTSRQNPAVFSADLDANGTDDLVVVDQFGKVWVVSNFHEAEDGTAGLNQIIFNPLTEDYHDLKFGRAWPVAAKLFDSKRPALVIGNVRGGIEIFRNEEKALQFDELSLSVYPNPVKQSAIVNVDLNIPMSVRLISILGQDLMAEPLLLEKGNNQFYVPKVSSGTYILKFSSGSRAVYRRLIIE